MKRLVEIVAVQIGAQQALELGQRAFAVDHPGCSAYQCRFRAPFRFDAPSKVRKAVLGNRVRQLGVQIDTLEKQKQQMAEMVAVCESRTDVFRYALFTGRMNSDPHFSSLLSNEGKLTELGQYYLTLPFANQ